MKHVVIEKAELKAKSEELGIPFSNLLAGYILESLMCLIAESEFHEFLWLKNGNIFGLEQYRKKNVLTLEFAYLTDEYIVKKQEFKPGQKLSLKLGYLMLSCILKKEKIPEIKWRGGVMEKDYGIDLEITGELEEMTVPLHIRITEMTESVLVPVHRKLLLFMEDNRSVDYLEYPSETILAEQLLAILKNMELIPEMKPYDTLYGILEKEAVDGRHIRDILSEFCKREHIIPQMERVDTILSYKTYAYMRKRWEKYLRHRGRVEPSWDDVMDKIGEFLPRIWKSICTDDIFFGDWMPELGRFLD